MCPHPLWRHAVLPGGAGVQQGYCLSPLIFITVTDALAITVGSQWQILFADDLAILAPIRMRTEDNYKNGKNPRRSSLEGWPRGDRIPCYKSTKQQVENMHPRYRITKI